MLEFMFILEDPLAFSNLFSRLLLLRYEEFIEERFLLDFLVELLFARGYTEFPA